MKKYNKSFDRNRRDPSDWRNGSPQGSTQYQHSVWLMGTFNNMKVELRDGESTESLLRRFKKMVEFSGTMRELKKREFALSKSQKRKLKKIKSIQRIKEEQRDQRSYPDHEEIKPAALYQD